MYEIGRMLGTYVGLCLRWAPVGLAVVGFGFGLRWLVRKGY